MIVNNQACDDYEESIRLTEKEGDYILRLDRHISLVKASFESLLIPYYKGMELLPESEYYSDSEFMEAVSYLIRSNAIESHDITKYSDYEFDQYRKHWYPTSYEETLDKDYWDKVEEEYQEAWKHHYMYNDHHPQHWINYNEDGTINEIKDMPLYAILHMLCDWEAMSIEKHEKTKEWYYSEDNDIKDKITAKTRELVEYLLDILPFK